MSDITGLTGMAIIRAILDGERNPGAVATLRDRRSKQTADTIACALQGNWRNEHLFDLRQAVDLVAFYHEQITACDRAIEACLERFDDKSGGQTLPSSRPRKPRGTDLAFDARSHLHRVTGVDLTRIDGIEAHTALKVIAEVGLDMTRWPSEKHFASWLGLAPGTKVSGGKKLSGRTKPSTSRAAAALRMAASSLHHSQSALGAFFQTDEGPARRAQGDHCATAHKLACLIYRILRFGTEYVDRGQDYYECPTSTTCCRT